MFTLTDDILRHPNLESRQLEWVNSGSFADVYRYKNIAYVVTNDPTKAILAKTPRHTNLPHIVHIGKVLRYNSQTEEINDLYIMPYYEIQLTPNYKDKHLRELTQKFIRISVQDCNNTHVHSNNQYYNLIEVLTQAFNNKKYKWDLVDRNIRLNKHGKVIVIDPIYCMNF